MKIPSLTQDPAIDRLTAMALLQATKLDTVYASLLLDTAQSWMGAASTIAPANRTSWALQHQSLFANTTDVEHAVARLALVWLGGSVFASDANAPWLDEKTSTEPVFDPTRYPVSVGQTQECVSHDNYAMVDACVSRIQSAFESGAAAVVLALTDRETVRRIMGKLQAINALDDVTIEDDYGWSLATSHSAARLMRLMEGSPTTAKSLHGQLQQVHDSLSATGLWSEFAQDAAGQKILEALHLHDWQGLTDTTMRTPMFERWVCDVLEQTRFSAYSNASMQGATKTLSLLPLAVVAYQKDVDWVIVPSADEANLPLRPSPAKGVYLSASQRMALGLASLDALQVRLQIQMHQLVAAHAGRIVFARAKTVNGQVVPASGWLELWRVEGRVENLLPNPSPTGVPSACLSANSRDIGTSINWSQLAPKTLSASAYADLKACPYRFFTTRVLGLKESPDLFDEVSKRDYGNWLHGVLQRFHSLAWDSQSSTAQMRLELERCAHAQTASMQLDPAAFLPFSLAWESTREAYLAWLTAHLAKGYQVKEVESWHERHIEVAGLAIRLVGKLDRVDSGLVDGQPVQLLMDYKTESLDKTRGRVGTPEEDTQLTFYAALFGSDTDVQAAYLHLPERFDGKNFARLLPLDNVQDNALRLMAELQGELLAVASGRPLHATGDEKACEYCAARAVCRKDFWQETAVKTEVKTEVRAS